VEHEAQAHELLKRKLLKVSGALAAALVLGLGLLLFLAGKSFLEWEDPSTQAKLQETVFRNIEKEYEPSTLFISVQFALQKGSDRVERWAMGTGFFVSRDGLVATNKHVVQPWKFSADVAMLRDQGYTLDESSARIAAWPEGSVLFTEPGEMDSDAAYQSENGTLRIVALPPDSMETREAALPHGGTYTGLFHAFNNADLAVLKASVSKPVKPFRLLPAGESVEKLDPIMVLGFPTGTSILEGGRAEGSPTLGQVRKVEETIYITAPILGGNSGGPVLDAKGQVIGIATRVLGEATLGSCIQARHLYPLLSSRTEGKGGK